MSEKTTLDCLYYPFARCLDEATLKSLLLTFDSITFMDEVESESHRRYLMKQMSVVDDSFFSEYEEIADRYDQFQEIGAINVLNPRDSPASSSSVVPLAVQADLEDDQFMRLASQPMKYGLPFRPHSAYGSRFTDRPTWQIFQGKIPLGLMSSFDPGGFLNSHLIFRGDSRLSWALSYEAGSSISLNYYLESADALQLVPVTTSRLHHQLVVSKLKRSFAAGESLDLLDSDERRRIRACMGFGEAVTLLRGIVRDF